MTPQIEIAWRMFSPIDLAVMEELAAAEPERSGALSELKRAIDPGR